MKLKGSLQRRSKGGFHENSGIVFPIALTLGAITLTPGLVRTQDFREEGPIEIEKCQTIDKPGSYKLVKNLTFSGTTGSCLTITTDFATIDLGGFTISGPTGAFAGITDFRTILAA